MTPKLLPLPYRRFINTLYFLNVYIPVFPAETGQQFMAYESQGTGSYPTPSGGRFTLVHRGDTETVPAREIKSALRHLRITPKIFLDTLAQQERESPPVVAPQSPSSQQPPPH